MTITRTARDGLELPAVGFGTFRPNGEAGAEATRERSAVAPGEEVAAITALSRPDGRIAAQDPATHEEF